MRIIVMFDLPTTKVKHKKEYVKFRRFLLQDGYDMMQYSIYIRLCKGTDGVKKHTLRLNRNLPQWGIVRSLTLTEKQFTDMGYLVGVPITMEEIRQPAQLTIF